MLGLGKSWVGSVPDGHQDSIIVAGGNRLLEQTRNPADAWRILGTGYAMLAEAMQSGRTWATAAKVK